ALLETLRGWRIEAKAAGKDWRLSVDRPTVKSDEKAPAQEVLRSSQVRSVSYRVAVINQSTVVDENEVRAAVKAIQAQLHNDFAPIWGVDADLTFVPTGSQAAPSSWLVVILDDSGEVNAVSYRDLTSGGLPLARVFAKTAQKNDYS